MTGHRIPARLQAQGQTAVKKFRNALRIAMGITAGVLFLLGFPLALILAPLLYAAERVRWHVREGIEK